jgi:ADP-ribose pyrophosphatase YjhB (NUDIX family)
MNKYEIDLIKSKSFEELWNEIWNNDISRINNLKKEFNIAKKQFSKLQEGNETDLNLDFYINNVKPIYNFNEWGFPKGRHDRNESTLECALREFTEETGIDINKIKLINNIEPIEENLVGTNGIPYRHIYYIAEVYDHILPNILNNNEIGNIGYFNFNESSELIRDYHTEKKNILRILHMYYLELLLNN